MSLKQSLPFCLSGLFCLLLISTSCIRQPQVKPSPSRSDPFLKTTSLIDGLRHEDPWVRVKSAEIAGTMEAEAEEAVPLLILMVAGPEEFGFFESRFIEERTALEALRSLGPLAIPGVMDALNSRRARVRRAAAEILGSFDSVGPESIQALVGALQDTQAPVRRSAILALAKVGRGSDFAAQELFKVLKFDREVRDDAARSLGELGSVAERYLRQAIQDQDPDIRRAAALGLAPLGSTGVLLLIEKLHDTDRAVVKSALLELATAKDQAAPSIDALIAILERDDGELQQEAIRVIATLGEAARPAIPHLIKALSSSNSEIRSSACWALASFGPTAKPAMASLSRLLDTEYCARGALLKIDVDTALVLLIDYLNEAGEGEQSSIAYDLSEYSAQAVPLLLSALPRHNTNGRIGVVRALGAMEKPDESAITALVTVFEHDESAVRAEAIGALVRLTPNSEVISSVVSRAFKESDPAIRLALLDSIRSENYMGIPSPDALIECFADPNMKVREAAVDALISAGNSSIPSLINGLDNQRQSVREYSVLTLGEMGRRQSNDELKIVVPYLVLALHYRDPGMPRIRMWTHGPIENYGTIADSLRRIGPATKSEVPALANALTHSVEEVREAAARELGRIGPDAAAAVPILLGSIEDKDPNSSRVGNCLFGKDRFRSSRRPTGTYRDPFNRSKHVC